MGFAMRVTTRHGQNQPNALRKKVRELNHKLPKYCTAELTRHGRIAIYYRKVGRTGRIRMRAEPGSPQFHREYAACLDGLLRSAEGAQRSSTDKGTWSWLCERYFSSIKFRDLEQIGQRVRRRQLESTWAQPISPGSLLTFGNCPLTKFNAKSVRILRDRRLKWVLPEDGAGATPIRANTQAANSLTKYIRGVLEWGTEEYPEHVERNWARDVSYLHSGSAGFHTWTLEEIDQFERRHGVGTRARLTLALALYTTQRRGDVVQLGRHLEREGLLVIEQEKNRRRRPVTAFVPIAPILRQLIDASPTGEKYYLVQERADRPFKKESLGNRFKEWCLEAGLPHCSLHGLRKAGVVRLIQEDFTPHQVMAVSGHRTLKEIDRYTREYLRQQAAERILTNWLERHI
jgi:integrase